MIDPNEQCDNSDLGGESCASLGFHDGALLCTSGCAFDLSQCKANSTPSVALTCAPTVGKDPLSVNCQADGTDPDGDPLFFSFNFGDGFSTPSLNNNASGVISGKRKHTLYVQVNDAFGGQASSQVAIHVSKPAVKGNGGGITITDCQYPYEFLAVELDDNNNEREMLDVVKSRTRLGLDGSQSVAIGNRFDCLEAGRTYQLWLQLAEEQPDYWTFQVRADGSLDRLNGDPQTFLVDTSFSAASNNGPSLSTTAKVRNKGCRIGGGFWMLLWISILSILYRFKRKANRSRLLRRFHQPAGGS